MDPLPIVFIVVLLVITGWFSGCETAISSCNQFKLRVRANDGSKTAKYAIKFIDKFDKSVISVLIGYNISSTIMSTLATAMFIVFLPSHLVNLVSTIVIAVLCYVFSDTLPKIVARAAPDTYLTLSVYPMIFFYYLFWPLTQFFNLVSKLVKKIFKVKEDVTITEEDYVIEAKDLTKQVVETIGGFKHLWGNGINEPLFVVKNIRISSKDVKKLGFNMVTFCKNDIFYIKNFANSSFIDEITCRDQIGFGEANLVIDMVCKFTQSKYGSRVEIVDYISRLDTDLIF